MSIQVIFWVKLSEDEHSVSAASQPFVFASQEAFDDCQVDHFDDIIPQLEKQTGAAITDPESQIEIFSITNVEEKSN